MILQNYPLHQLKAKKDMNSLRTGGTTSAGVFSIYNGK